MAKANPVKNIPNLNSEGSDWIEFHRSLKSNLGKKKANSWFLRYWRKQGDTNKAKTHDLREYLSKNGINLEKGVLESVYDAGDDYIENIASIFNVGKYALFAIVGITVVGLGIAVYNIAKNPAQSAALAAKLAV